MSYFVFCCKLFICNCSGSITSVGEERTDLGGRVAQWLGRRISDQGVPGSNPGRCTFRCGLEQVTFTLLSTG